MESKQLCGGKYDFPYTISEMIELLEKIKVVVGGDMPVYFGSEVDWVSAVVQYEVMDKPGGWKGEPGNTTCQHPALATFRPYLCFSGRYY